MLKQITISNLYNFKEEITIDFDSSGREKTSFHTFNKDSISNFSLIYGKNNVGKSNFFLTLKESVDFIIHGIMKMKPYYPQLTDRPSSVEIIFQNRNHEIRYGFELLIKNKVIKDEWMFAKLNNSSRESVIFQRQNFKTHFSISKNDANSLLEIKDTVLFLNYFNKINHNNEYIHDLMKSFKQLQFIDCVNSDDQESITDGVFNLSKKREDYELFNYLLGVADLDIKEVQFKKLSEDQMNILEKVNAIFMSKMDEDEKTTQSKKLIEENSDIIPTLLNRDLVGSGAREAKSIEFLHRNGGVFRFKDLSSGTKQIINILSIVVLNRANPNVFIFDEIETGLHSELIDFSLNFFKIIADENTETQFIITTHQEELLDTDFISNENKVFLKYDDEIQSPVIEYLSEYRLRDYEKVSQRYKMNAFQTNPNTSELYNLKNELFLNKTDGEGL